MKKYYLTFSVFLFFLTIASSFASESSALNDFNSDIKNYIYKCQKKSSQTAVVKDIKNIKMKILKQIKQNPNFYYELQNFICDNPEFSGMFGDFAKKSIEKQKFEALQKGTGQKQNFSETSIKASSDITKYKISMAEKMLFDFKFTSRSAARMSRYIDESPEILKEYQSIKSEFDEINDMETLNQKGPAVAKRCEALLLNPNGGFYNIERLENVVLMAAAINVRLGSTDWETAGSPALKMRIIERITKLYGLATNVKHKCLITMTLSNAYLGVDMPHKALSVSYDNKKDFYNSLSDSDKSTFIWYLASDLALECPPGNDESLKIGIDCFYEYCRLADLNTNSDENHKINFRAQVYLEATSVLYEKNEKYFEAIIELDKIINNDQINTWFKDKALEKKNILQTFLNLKIDVMFSNEFMNDKWKAVDKPYKYIPLLVGQKIKLKVQLEQPSGSNIQFDSVNWYGEFQESKPEFEISFLEPGKKEFRVEVSLLEKTIIRRLVVYVKNKPEGINERDYASKHLKKSLIAVQFNLITLGDPATLEPYKWSAKTFISGSHNGIQDAARHAYWNCLLTRYCGEDYAIGITDGHEINTPSEQFSEVVMDLHNNEQGRQTAKNHSHNSENDYSCCQTAITKSIDAGQPLCFDDIENIKKDALLLPTNKK